MDVLEAAALLAASSPDAVSAAARSLAEAGASVAGHGASVGQAMPSADQWSGSSKDAYVGAARELAGATGVVGRGLTAGGQAVLAYAGALAAARAAAVRALRRADWARQVAALVVQVGTLDPAKASSYARTATTAWGEAQQEAARAWTEASSAAQALEQALRAQAQTMGSAAGSLGGKDFADALGAVGSLFALPLAVAGAGLVAEGELGIGGSVLLATTVADAIGSGGSAPVPAMPPNPADGKDVLPPETGPRPGRADYYTFKVGEHELPGPLFVEGGTYASTKIAGGHGDGPGVTAGLLYGGGAGADVDGVSLHGGVLHEHSVGYETGADGRLHAVDERENYLNLEAGVGPVAFGALVNEQGIAVYKATEGAHGVWTGDGFSVVLPEAVTDEIGDTLRFVGERMHD